jgi:hypothetical protein
MKVLQTTLLFVVALGSGLALTSFFLSDPVTVKLQHAPSLSPGQTALVEVNINKGIIEGFGLLEITLPLDTKAEAVELNGASFTIENGKIRIVWMRMPNDPELKLTFNLIHLKANGEPIALSLVGNFSHIENNYRKDVAFESNGSDSNTPLEAKSPELTADATIHSEQAPPPSQELTLQTNKPDNKNIQSEVVKQTNNELTFRVQILASHKVVDKTFLSRFYGFKNAFNIEHHNGWEKYVTGDFKNLEEARQLRQEIALAHPLLPGPFVTAYKGNERISVTEALQLQMTASL